MIVIIAVLSVGVFLVVVGGTGGYFLWKSVKNQKAVPSASPIGAEEAAQKAVEDATRGTLPSIQTNPFEDKPNLNPAEKANPIKNIKTNPFE